MDLFPLVSEWIFLCLSISIGVSCKCCWHSWQKYILVKGLATTSSSSADCSSVVISKSKNKYVVQLINVEIYNALNLYHIYSRT